MKKVGLLDHMGGGNLGDDTTQTAIMANIASRWPTARMYGFSMNPADTEARHKIASFPIRQIGWDAPDAIHFDTQSHNVFTRLFIKKPRTILAELRFLVKSFKIVKTLDLLLMSGGGQLLDNHGGPWEFPYTLFKWTLLAKLAGTKCYYLNVGAGPLDTALGKRFIRYALRMADYVSFRDEKSRAIAREAGYDGASTVCPDCVYGLDVSSYRSQTMTTQVGMSPIPYGDPRRYWLQDQDVYDDFVEKLATFGEWITRRGAELTLFSTDIWFDRQVLHDVDSALKASGVALVEHEPIVDVATLLSTMAPMDYVFTCRYHGVVFAHMMNKPVIALAHHPKVSTLMADLGLADYCFDISTFDVESLQAAFLHLTENKAVVKARMAEIAEAYSQALSEQFDYLFPREQV